MPLNSKSSPWGKAEQYRKPTKYHPRVRDNRDTDKLREHSVITSTSKCDPSPLAKNRGRAADVDTTGETTYAADKPTPSKERNDNDHKEDQEENIEENEEGEGHSDDDSDVDSELSSDAKSSVSDVDESNAYYRESPGNDGDEEDETSRDSMELTRVLMRANEELIPLPLPDDISINDCPCSDADCSSRRKCNKTGCKRCMKYETAKQGSRRSSEDSILGIEKELAKHYARLQLRDKIRNQQQNAEALPVDIARLQSELLLEHESTVEAKEEQSKFFDTVLSSILGRRREGVPCEPSKPLTHWATAYYFEEKHMVGAPYKAFDTIFVVDSCNENDPWRMSVGSAIAGHSKPVSAVVRNQMGLGRGLAFVFEDGVVTLKVLTTVTVFVQCPQHAMMKGDPPNMIYRLARNTENPEEIEQMVVFDEQYFKREISRIDSAKYYALLQNHLITRISFIKGFGMEYARKYITQTPSWIEIQMTYMQKEFDLAFRNVLGPEMEIDETL